MRFRCVKRPANIPLPDVRDFRLHDVRHFRLGDFRPHETVEKNKSIFFFSLCSAVHEILKKNITFFNIFRREIWERFLYVAVTGRGR